MPAQIGLRTRAAKPKPCFSRPVREAVGNPELKAYLRALLADPCAYCGAPATAIDHIVPVSRGGEDCWENLTGACRRCNISKSRAHLIGFLGYRRSQRRRALLERELTAERRYRLVGVPA